MKSPRERLILIVDSKCAKFFHTKNFKMKGEIHLTKIADFGIEHKIHALHTGGSAPSGKQAHVLDSKHNAKELDRKAFCKQVINQVRDELHHNAFEELVIIAGPKVLGDIRTMLPKEIKHLDIQEIHKDLTHFSKEKIEQYLKSIC